MMVSGCTVVKKDSLEYTLQKETNTYTVTAYKDLQSVTTLTVPDEVDGIAVTEIAKHGLSNSDYLTEITLGDNIQKIDVWAIRNNPALTKIIVSENNANYKSVDGVLFSKDGKTLIAFPNKKADSYVIPEGVEKIEDMAFYKCSNLKEIKLSSTVKEVGDMAFLKALALNKTTFNEGLNSIGKNAFLGCEKLTNIEIPKTIESIGEFAFYNCVNLLNIRVYKAEADIGLGKKWYPTKAGQDIKEVQVIFGEAT
jgi:hypothetical protein